MKQFRNHIYIFTLCLCVIALGLFLVLTNPEQVSIGLLIVPVLLLFFIAFSLAQIILNGLKLFPGKPLRRRVVALIGASFATLVLILQSTGGVSVPDVLLLTLIIGMVSVYINKF